MSNKKSFAYTPDDIPSHWKLDVSDREHVIMAKTALEKGFRGQKVRIPDEDMPAVINKVNAAARKYKLSPIGEESKDTVEHFGVKGMKWGVRKKRRSADFNEAQRLRKKNPDTLSNKELQTLNTRMNLENQYRTNRINNQSQARKYAKQILVGTAVSTATAIMTKNYPELISSGKSLASKILNTPQAKELVVDPIVGVKNKAGRKVVKGAVDAANAAVSLKRKFKK